MHYFKYIAKVSDFCDYYMLAEIEIEQLLTHRKHKPVVPTIMNFKHICLLSVLFLFISGCISNENKAQDNATNLDGDQPIASKNSHNPDFKVITIETWDERSATVESDGDLIYKRDGSYYSRNLETNEEKSVPPDYSISVDGTKGTRNIFIADISKNITGVDCQFYKHISYYGQAETFDINTGCISVDGKKVAFLADGWEGNNKGVYKGLYYYDLESNEAHKLLSDGRISSIVGWTNNNEIIFDEHTRDVDFKSPIPESWQSCLGSVPDLLDSNNIEVPDGL